MVAMGTLSGRESSPDKKRLDRGKHGVLGYRLNSDLWATVPEPLVEEILAKLPFSTLVRLCGVCKRWRHLILSAEISPRCTSLHGHLCFFADGKLTAFNSSRGTWEIIPLEFLPVEITLVDLVVSSGPFLCFSTATVGEFIVCNPLTKRYKRLQLPHRRRSTASDQPDWPNPGSADWGQGLLVGMILDSDDGHFKLMVARMFQVCGVETLVYDSLANTWKKVADMPSFCYNGRPLNKNPTRTACGGHLYVYFDGASMDDARGDRLFKYNVDQKAWVWIRFPQFDGNIRNVTEHNGKILLVTSTFEYSPVFEGIVMLVFQLEEEGASGSWLPTNRLPLSRVQGAMPDMKGIKCLGQGDVMFFLKMHRLERAAPLITGTSRFGCYRGYYAPLAIRTCVREWYHNDATNSEEMSNWEEYNGEDIADFKIFKPSMLGLNPSRTRLAKSDIK